MFTLLNVSPLAIAMASAQVEQEQPLIPTVSTDKTNDENKIDEHKEEKTIKPEKITEKKYDEIKKEAEVTQEKTDIRSLLFSENDVKALRSARAFYERSQSGKGNGEFSEDDFLKKLENAAKEKIISSDEFEYPQFFLSTLVYRSKNDWVVWVNNEKITQQDVVSASGLKVIYINREKVSFEWRPERLDKIVDITDYSSDGDVGVDMANKIVIFTLKPNQTFSSYAMKVVEGKVMPMVDAHDSVVSGKIGKKSR